MSLIQSGNKETGFYNSPAGILKIDSDGKFITSVSFIDDDFGVNERNLLNSNLVEACKEELDAYFNGKLKGFTVPVKSYGTDFQQKVWQHVSTISYGKTVTYSALAQQMGSLKLTRAVGQANGKNTLAILIPCHRVVGKNNELQGYAWGIARKKILLEREGSIFLSRQMTLF